MKQDWLITFRSVTFAQHAERSLRRENISCQLQRTPKMLNTRGCGYCLRLRGDDALSAVAILRSEQIPYGKLFVWNDNGMPEEKIL